MVAGVDFNKAVKEFLNLLDRVEGLEIVLTCAKEVIAKYYHANHHEVKAWKALIDAIDGLEKLGK